MTNESSSQPAVVYHTFLACVAACQDCQPEFLEAAMNLARRAATRGRNTGRRYERPHTASGWTPFAPVNFVTKAVYSSIEKCTMQKKDFPSHQTCDTCIKY
jgi:triphosphoribosyl-dephospho-CoA synthetase